MESATIVLLLAVYLVVQCVYLAEPREFDPADYMQFAANLPPELIHHRPLRIGLVIPLWAVMEVLGYSELTFYGFAYAAGSALVVSVYGLGRVLFSRTLAIAAAFATMTFPLMLQVSSQIWPDIPGVALFTSGVVLVVAASNSRTVSTRPAIYYPLLLFAGVIFGWAYLVREVVVILFPLVLLIWWLIKIPWRHLVIVAAGAFTMFLGELAWGAYVHDDPFVRLGVLLDRVSRVTDPPTSPAGTTGLGGRLLESLWTFAQMLTTHRGIRLLLIAMMASLAAATLFFRRTSLLVVSAWLFGGWLMIALIGTESRVLTVEAQSRYWLPLLPPIIVGGLAGVQATIRAVTPPRRPLLGVFGTISPLLLALVLVISGIHEMNTEGFAFGQPHREESSLYEIREWLEAEGEDWDLIWTDVFTVRTLPMYTRSFFGTPIWDGQVRRFRGDMTEGDRDGLLIFRTSSLGGPRRPEIPSYLPAPPRDWSVEFISENGDMVAYGIGSGDRFTEVGSIGDPSKAAAWLAIEDDGTEIPRGGTSQVLELESGEGLRLIDDNGPGNLTEAGTESPTVDAGSYVRLRGQMKIEGDGSMEVFCLFYEGEEVTRVSSSSALSRTLERTFEKSFQGNVDFLCETPLAMEQQQLRVEIRLQGPLHLELNPFQVETDNG